MSEQAKQAIAEINKRADFWIRSMAQELRYWKIKQFGNEATKWNK